MRNIEFFKFSYFFFAFRICNCFLTRTIVSIPETMYMIFFFQKHVIACSNVQEAERLKRHHTTIQNTNLSVNSARVEKRTNSKRNYFVIVW